MLRKIISTVSRTWLSHRFSAIELARGCAVDFWKLRPRDCNRLSVGSNSMLATRVVFERPGASLTLGARSFVGLGLISVASCVEIGDDVMIAWGTTITDHNSHSTHFSQRRHDVSAWLTGAKDWQGVKIAPVRINHGAWLGFNVSVLPGVEIGVGSIVGAGSVVTRDIPAWTVAAGNPARIVRELNVDERA